MTNTRIGDLELLETRFPAMLKEFSILRGTGGRGKYNGGDGIRRVYKALVGMDASHDGQRRVIAPHGSHGGLDGERGASYLKKETTKGGYRIVKLKPAHQVSCVLSHTTQKILTSSMLAGEELIVHTAGAGGWGAPEVQQDEQAAIRSTITPKAGHTAPPYTRANGSVTQYSQTQAECD